MPLFRPQFVPRDCPKNFATSQSSSLIWRRCLWTFPKTQIPLCHRQIWPLLEWERKYFKLTNKKILINKSNVVKYTDSSSSVRSFYLWYRVIEIMIKIGLFKKCILKLVCYWNVNANSWNYLRSISLSHLMSKTCTELANMYCSELELCLAC